MIQKDMVTVIITTYKRRINQIKKAIESVLHQTYKNVELIIVDDSPDDFIYRKEVKKFCESIIDKKVTYIQHEKNLGACMARNTGLYLSKGKYISFLDDDDEYLPTRIEEMLSLFNDDVVLVYCNANIIDLNNINKKRTYFDDGKQYRGNVYHKIMENNFVGSTSFGLIRTEVLMKLGGFDPKIEASQDWDIWIRLAEKGKFEYVSTSLVNYYIYSGDRITNDIKRRIRGLRYLNKKNYKYLCQHPAAMVNRKGYELRLNILNYDIKGAITCYGEIIKLQPYKVLKNISYLKSFGRLIIRKK